MNRLGRTITGPRADLQNVLAADEIEALELRGSGIASLTGIERMRRLRHLRIANMVAPRLDLLAELPELRVLTLRTLGGEVDFSPLGRCERLTELHVEFASEASAAAFDAPLGRLSQLTMLQLENRHGSGVPIELEWVATADRLRHLALIGFICERFDDLRAATQLRWLTMTSSPAAVGSIMRTALPRAEVQVYTP